MATIQCPGCDTQLDEEDFKAQSEHMRVEHPDIIAARLRDNGFVLGPDGQWHDAWAAD